VRLVMPSTGPSLKCCEMGATSNTVHLTTIRRFHSDENWELSIDQIGSDLTNAQFPILNSHPNGKLTQIRPLSVKTSVYGNPINRPAIATLDHSESETTAASLLQTGLMCVSSAMATLRRTAKVKTSARDKAAIFTQKAVR